MFGESLFTSLLVSSRWPILRVRFKYGITLFQKRVAKQKGSKTFIQFKDEDTIASCFEGFDFVPIQAALYNLLYGQWRQDSLNSYLNSSHFSLQGYHYISFVRKRFLWNEPSCEKITQLISAISIILLHHPNIIFVEIIVFMISLTESICNSHAKAEIIDRSLLKAK